MPNLQAKIYDALQIINQAYEKYKNIPWTLGFSGGKDSTTTLHLLILSNVKVNIYVIYADTLFEHPVLRKYTLEALESLKEFNNIKPIILKPLEGEDAISMMVEKGYPPAGPRFRWCMDRFKLKPYRHFIKQFDKYLTISGVRLEESNERKRNIRKNYNEYKLVDGDYPVLMPILDWSYEDVINFLASNKRWDGKSYDYLLKLYEVVDYVNGCGCPFKTDVRFGCWICTVVRKDKMNTSPILKQAREELIRIKKDPALREIKNGRLGKLNEKGKREIAKVFLKVLNEYPEAFGYENKEEIRIKLEKYI